MSNLFDLNFNISLTNRVKLIQKHEGTPFFYDPDFKCLNCNKILETKHFNGEYCCSECRSFNNFKKRYGGKT